MALGSDRLLALPQPAEKAAMVRAMFDRIAPRYDRMNAIISWRLDRGWRRAAIAAATLTPGQVAFDVACGTGDLAALAATTGARVIAVDYAPAMLAVARRRGITARLLRADAMALPLRDATGDALACGFALRNFTALPPFLAEAARVLRPGGRLVLLEVGTPDNPLLRLGHRLYFNHVVPLLGALLADRWAYAYLPRSVVYLPAPPALRLMVAGAGFIDVQVRRLTCGLAQLITARRAEVQ